MRRAPSHREKRQPCASRPGPRHCARLARLCLGPAPGFRALAGRVGPEAPSSPRTNPGRRERPAATAARRDLVAWRDAIHHRPPLRAGVGHRGPPLTPHASPGESAKQHGRFRRGPVRPQLHRRLGPIELGAPWRHPQGCLQGRHAAAARATRARGALKRHRPPIVSTVRATGARAVQARSHWGQRVCGRVDAPRGACSTIVSVNGPPRTRYPQQRPWGTPRVAG